MDVATMRRADRWLGVPACAALTLYRRLADRLRPPPLDRPVRRILFVKLAEQGATVLAYGALRRAVEMVGRENVYFLVFQENRFILDVMEIIPPENVIAMRTDSMRRAVTEALRAIRRLRQLRLDAAIDMEFFARSSAALSYLSGARCRVGFHAFAGEASYRGDLMTHRLSFNSHLHASLTFRVLVEALEADPKRLPALDVVPAEEHTVPPMFKVQRGEAEEVRQVIGDIARAPADAPIILLNANCSDLLPLRRWPTERYVSLAHRILDRYPDVWLLLTGAPDEAPGADALARQIDSPRCVSMAGRTTLRQLLVLYGLAEVLVTNDSGPAHFATLTPIDVITMFGPETPHLFGARTPRSHILWSGIACSPCVNAYNDRLSSCRDNICMQRLSVGEVFQTVCRVFEARGGGARSGGNPTAGR